MKVRVFIRICIYEVILLKFFVNKVIDNYYLIYIRLKKIIIKYIRLFRRWLLVC